MTLCDHCKTLELINPKTAWAHTQLDFPLGYWTWVVKYKANYFGWKKLQKSVETHKINELKSLSLGSFWKQATKSLFSFPLY